MFGFFFSENIISGMQRFDICPQVLVEIRIVVFFSDFLAENLKCKKKLVKRSLILQYSFAMKTSLILRT